MAEDDRTVETPVDGDPHGIDDARQRAEGTDDPDSSVDAFFELDEQLEYPSDAPGGGPRRGLVVDAERVGRSTVPDGYPLSTASGEAVALTVDFGTEATTVYLAWPDDGGAPLTWLLDAMDATMADLYGEGVLVERRGGHDALVAPAEPPRGSDRQATILGGLGVVAGFLGLLAFVSGPTAAAGLVWTLVTLVALPYAVYTDAWYARTHSDWAGGPLFWAALAALPFLNLATVPVYLLGRSRATFLEERSSLPARAARRIRSWL